MTNAAVKVLTASSVVLAFFSNMKVGAALVPPYKLQTMPRCGLRICKQHASNAHLLLVACIKFVRGSYDHMKGPHTIIQRRLHVVVEVTSWQPCCLQGGEVCHVLRVVFGNSDLQPYKHKKSFAQCPTTTYAWQ